MVRLKQDVRSVVEDNRKMVVFDGEPLRVGILMAVRGWRDTTSKYSHAGEKSAAGNHQIIMYLESQRLEADTSYQQNGNFCNFHLGVCWFEL